MIIDECGSVRLCRDNERVFLRSASLNTGYRDSRILLSRNDCLVVGNVYNIYVAVDRRNRVLGEFRTYSEIEKFKGDGVNRLCFQQLDCEVIVRDFQHERHAFLAGLERDGSSPTD